MDNNLAWTTILTFMVFKTLFYYADRKGIIVSYTEVPLPFPSSKTGKMLSLFKHFSKATDNISAKRT